MAISKHSKIYYGLKIDTNSRYLDFKEGSLVFKAVIQVGSYTGSKLAIEIKKQMDAVGAYTYAVIYNRSDRKFVISASSPFTLLCGTGINSSISVFQVIGFSSVDKSGLSSYTSDVSSGHEYKTQFYIQSHQPTSQNRKAIDGVINESASGFIEVVKFGNKRFLSGEFNFITNIVQGAGSLIRSNGTGLQDFVQLMEWLTNKYLVEIMIDETKTEEYETFILESTQTDSKGLDYELTELYDKGLPEYFKSGVLKFRLME